MGPIITPILTHLAIAVVTATGSTIWYKNSVRKLQKTHDEKLLDLSDIVQENSSLKEDLEKQMKVHEFNLDQLEQEKETNQELRKEVADARLKIAEVDQCFEGVDEAIKAALKNTN